MTTLTAVLLGSLLACTEGDTEEPPDIWTTDTDTETCGGTAPEADSLLVYNGGPINFEGEDAPTIRLELHLTDADRDLSKGTFEFWHDLVYDDDVDTDDDPTDDRTFSQIGDACDTDEATLRLNIRVGGEGYVFQYNTVYEFAARFIDAGGVPSNTLVAAGVTPKEDFSDGDWPGDDSGL